MRFHLRSASSPCLRRLPRRCQSSRLALEVLEDRTLPSSNVFALSLTESGRLTAATHAVQSATHVSLLARNGQLLMQSDNQSLRNSDEAIAEYLEPGLYFLQVDSLASRPNSCALVTLHSGADDPWVAVAGDLNHDGIQDLIGANNGNDVLSLALGQAEGLMPPRLLSSGSLAQPSGLAVRTDGSTLTVSQPGAQSMLPIEFNLDLEFATEKPSLLTHNAAGGEGGVRAVSLSSLTESSLATVATLLNTRIEQAAERTETVEATDAPETLFARGIQVVHAGERSGDGGPILSGPAEAIVSDVPLELTAPGPTPALDVTGFVSGLDEALEGAAGADLSRRLLQSRDPAPTAETESPSDGRQDSSPWSLEDAATGRGKHLDSTQVGFPAQPLGAIVVDVLGQANVSAQQPIHNALPTEVVPLSLSFQMIDSAALPGTHRSSTDGTASPTDPVIGGLLLWLAAGLRGTEPVRRRAARAGANPIVDVFKSIG